MSPTEEQSDNARPKAAPLIERVLATPSFASLRVGVESAARAAAELARIEAGRAIDRPDEAMLEKLRVQRRVHVTGLRGSAVAFLAESIRARFVRPVLVVCPDEETAEDTHSDLRTISTGRPSLLPERNILPHRHERENLSVRGERNDSLSRIAGGDTDIVVTSLLGFLEKTIPVASLRANRREIRTGETVDLEELRVHLVDLGYDVVPVVEEPGQFAVRGSIVDVYDPSWEEPARIELFDDEVESIRSFDLDTQRSIAPRESVAILPAASVPFEAESVTHLRAFLSERDFEAKDIDAVVEHVSSNRHSFLWRRYAPALGMDGNLLDFFPEPPIILFTDTAALDRMNAKHALDFENAANREDDFPLLRLSDYLLEPNYHERFGVATVWHWALTTPKSATPGPAGGSREEKDENNLDRYAEAPPDGAEEAGEGPYPPPEANERTVRFSTLSHPSVSGKLDPLFRALRRYRNKGIDAYIYSETETQRERLADMLEDVEELVHLPVGWFTSGFVWEDAGIAVLTDHQIFERILPRPKRRAPKRRVGAIRHDNLVLGDFVVHVDYGIARYVGLDKVGAETGEAECLVLRFHGGDKIYVPLDQMHVVEKYVGREGVAPQVDKLGGTRWQKTREKARRAIEDIAEDLLRIYAQREQAEGYSYRPDTQWQKELEASFPYEETVDQLRATEEIKRDMESPKPMDRLVCGDVGFGKTEVAIRAAFKAAADGRQVAVLVPTTLLAFQHFNTFRDRVRQFPMRVEMLSRFVSPGDQKKVLAGLAEGTVDIVVATHRLLSRDVVFKNIGLLIVDEEHRFGVKHKERIKEIAAGVDVLSLTATPIPRTLYMSLSGLRNISVIDTPPRNRHPVRTNVTAFDEETIIGAITEEISRGGQVFFIHNRVQSIHSMQAFLERLLPGIRFAVAHGQMGEKELEAVMLAFIEKKYDVLISTMIVESGLDLPNVNTIVVNRADRFGLAQLYQLRGRVGRREQQAYAHFLVPRQMSLTDTASRRLQAMEEFEELGSGYRLAMRDLEIRGAGNVLGVAQHGHVAAIGFEMYCKMLAEAVERLTADGETPAQTVQCRVESPYEYFVPADYIDDADERMMIYKRIAGFVRIEQLDAITDELRDRFGPPPRPVAHLLDLAHVKLAAAALGVVQVQIREPGYRPPTPEALRQAAEVPRTPTAAPRGVPRAAHQSSRLKRLAQTIGTGGLGAPGGGAGFVTMEFGPGRSFSPEQCARLVETFGARVLFKSGKNFGLQLEADPSMPQLTDVRNLLQVAAFSSKINALPERAVSEEG